MRIIVDPGVIVSMGRVGVCKKLIAFQCYEWGKGWQSVEEVWNSELHAYGITGPLFIYEKYKSHLL